MAVAGLLLQRLPVRGIAMLYDAAAGLRAYPAASPLAWLLATVAGLAARALALRARVSSGGGSGLPLSRRRARP